MELTLAQIRKINVLSDSVLYPEAVAFLDRLINEHECHPILLSQITGLFNIAYTNNYTQLRDFVHHQRDKNWLGQKRDIKKFYTELAQYFTQMELRRVRTEFRLVANDLNASQTLTMTYEVMALLAREFIQHLVAENNRLDQIFKAQRARGR